MNQANSIWRLTKRSGGVRFVILALLLTTSFCFAQPQAPIEWGEARFFGIGHGESARGILLMGDTIVCVADSFNQGWIPITCYSHDNGLTFSPWLSLTEHFWQSTYTTIAGSDGITFAFCRADSDDADPRPIGWSLRSLNGGGAWIISQPQSLGTYPIRGLVSDQQVICLQNHRLPDETYVRQVAISDDGGDDWNPSVILSDNSEFQLRLLAVTQGHIIVCGRDNSGTFPVVSVFTSDRTGQIWSGFHPIEEEPLGIFGVMSVAGDPTSEVAAILTALEIGPDSLNELFVIRSTDGGANWEAPRALTSGQSIDLSYGLPQIFCGGKLWGVIWDNFWDENPSLQGAYFSFSANHGKDWYPPCYLGVNVPFMVYSGGQFVGSQVRAYWSDAMSPVPHWDYVTSTGIITSDAQIPELSPDYLIADSVAIETAVMIGATAIDNDTLSEVRCVIMDSAGTIQRVVMPDQGTDHFDTTWTVPYPGFFRYRYEAEDFWENIGMYPDSGWLTFATDGWTEAADVLLEPVSYDVMVFPNPSNVWPIVKLSPGWITRDVSQIAIYNVLGQRVFQTKVTNTTFTFPFELPVASGLFLLEVSNPLAKYRQKILILK